MSKFVRNTIVVTMYRIEQISTLGYSLMRSKCVPSNMLKVIFMSDKADFGMPAKSGSDCSNALIAEAKAMQKKMMPSRKSATSESTRKQTSAQAEMRVEKTLRSMSKEKYRSIATVEITE